MKVIAHTYCSGNGLAIKTGIRHACGEILLVMDGEGQEGLRIAGRLAEEEIPIERFASKLLVKAVKIMAKGMKIWDLDRVASEC